MTRRLITIREIVLFGVPLFLLIATVLLLVPDSSADERDATYPFLSAHSHNPRGARALALWLGELGYHPTSLEYRPFTVDAETKLLFVMWPTEEFSEADVSQVRTWVERGGTLVIVDERSNSLLKNLGIEITREPGALDVAVPRQPLFAHTNLTQVEVRTRNRLRLVAPAWVPLLGAAESDDRTVAAVASFGEGRAYVISSLHALSNRGIAQADNWRLVLHILRDIPPESIIAFDEYHHGLTEHGTLGARLVREPWGWAFLYSAAAIFLYAAARGRRFGPALPPPTVGIRRSRGEYVSTLAALLRNGQQRAWVRTQFVSQTKRALGARYRIRADLPTPEFVAALTLRRPAAAPIAEPLERLEQNAIDDDATMIRYMRDVDRIMTRLVKG